jgi:AcrR family transcriptional regulator
MGEEAATEGSDAFFDAVQRAVDEKGLDRVSQDDIIRHSGVPRTTLYRRYGNRDAVLAAFVLDRTAADIKECQRLAMGRGAFAERLEEIMVFAVLAAHRHKWIQSELDRGPSLAVLDLLANAMKVSSEQTLMPLLRDAKAAGICRCPAPLDELQRWLVVQIFELSRQQFASAEEARRVVRTYILPVLALDTSSTAVGEKIDFIYQHVRALVEAAGRDV